MPTLGQTGDETRFISIYVAILLNFLIFLLSKSNVQSLSGERVHSIS